MFDFLKRRWKIKVPISTKAERSYYGLMQKVQQAQTSEEKGKLLERQLRLLPAFVSNSLIEDELPPIIPCRDELPELYMRAGNWKEAERVIKFCMAENAYYPDTGEDSLRYLLNYKTAAETTLKFLKDNPGYLQKNIYKALANAELDDYSLKHFIRCSEQIKKVPFQGTNKLYAK